MNAISLERNRTAVGVNIEITLLVAACSSGTTVRSVGAPGEPSPPSINPGGPPETKPGGPPETRPEDAPTGLACQAFALYHYSPGPLSGSATAEQAIEDDLQRSLPQLKSLTTSKAVDTSPTSKVFEFYDKGAKVVEVQVDLHDGQWHILRKKICNTTEAAARGKGA